MPKASTKRAVTRTKLVVVLRRRPWRRVRRETTVRWQLLRERKAEAAVKLKASMMQTRRQNGRRLEWESWPEALAFIQGLRLWVVGVGRLLPVVVFFLTTVICVGALLVCR